MYKALYCIERFLLKISIEGERNNGSIKEEDWCLSGTVCSTEYREKIPMGNLGQLLPETKEGPKYFNLKIAFLNNY